MNISTPQGVSATGTISGNPTAIFTLVTSIVANASVAGTATNRVSVQGDLFSVSSLTTGVLYNRVGGSLNSISQIALLQSFTFPWVFPFAINDKVESTVALSGAVTVASSINNVSVWMQSITSITGTLTSTVPPLGTLSSSSVIGPASITPKMALGGHITASSSINVQDTD